MHTAPRTRPDWPEIGIGLLGIAVFGIGLAFMVVGLPISPVAIGLILTAVSGVGGFVGFFMAFGLRIRRWDAFGIRRTSRRWLIIALAAGLFAFFAKSLAIIAYVALSGDAANIQEIYGEGGSGGWASLVLATLFLTLLTPLGEEFLFRGVVTSALLKYGSIIGVQGGALVFALFHGVNAVFPAALVTGLIAGELFRRSGSIWPAVVVHALVNAPTVPAMVFLNTLDL